MMKIFNSSHVSHFIPTLFGVLTYLVILETVQNLTTFSYLY